MNTDFLAALILTLTCSMAAGEEKPAAREASSGVVSKLITTTHGRGGTFRVSSDGNVVPFDLPAGTKFGSAGPEGSNDPLPSPDGRLLALVQNGRLLIRTLEGGQSTRVVSGYQNELLLITGWSPDGQHLVYFLAPPQAEDPPPSKVSVPKHFVFDLKTKASREINPGGTLCGWLPSGDMLIHDEENGAIRSLSLAPGAAPKLVLKDAAGFSQIALSPDGRQIAVNRSKPTSSSQLIAVDLATETVTPWNKAGAWAEYQWPKWSPSGKRTSWQVRIRTDNGMPKSVLAVDGKSITRPTDMLGYLWLTETALVVIELDALVVVDAASGKELGRKPTGPSSKPE